MPDRILTDFEGKPVRLTEERREHILEHPEMATLETALDDTILNPETVVQSRSDPEAHLYYRHYVGTVIGDKFLCVVVKVAGADAFIVTAYLTDRVKKGVQIWPSDG